MKFLKKIFNRFTLISFLLAVQLAWIIIGAIYLSSYYYFFAAAFRVLSVIVVLFIINRRYEPGIKLAWVIPILIFPIFGWAVYLIFGSKISLNMLKSRFNRYMTGRRQRLPERTQTIDEIKTLDKYASGQFAYVAGRGFPAYSGCTVKYYPSGALMFEDMLFELEKAEKFVFMEYYIIGEGFMWDRILDILKRKAETGVDVRVIYDDFGSINYLPSKYFKTLESVGIKCVPFNRLKPLLSVSANNRDHRKITVIDGVTAFTGGVNLADEYIGKKERFGNWKDSAIMIKGEAVSSLTALFLEIWNFNRRGTDTDISPFIGLSDGHGCASEGYVQPFGDSPLDTELLSENVYLNIINHAKEYLYISTPYISVDSSLISALTLAAGRGVDVRIIIPGVPDKRIVYRLTKSHCHILRSGGVRIYRYDPGFNHAKVILCDGELATVGTVNLDYRSLYHNFENGVLLYRCTAISDIRADFDGMLEISTEYREPRRRHGLVTNFFYTVLRLFSPLF